MINKIFFWSFKLLLVLSAYTNGVLAQNIALTRKEKKSVQITQLVKLGSECSDQTWTSLTAELSMIFGPSEKGEILNKEFECFNNARYDYYLKTNNQFQGRNVKIYFFEPEKNQNAGNSTFVTFANAKDLISLVRSELQGRKYSKKDKLELVIIEGRSLSPKWMNKIEDGWTIERPMTDYDTDSEYNCNCRDQILYKVKPCREISTFKFDMLPTMKLSATEYDAIRIFPSGEEETYSLQTKIFCGQAFKFRFYDDKNNVIKEMEFSDEVITRDNLKFRIYRDGGQAGSIQNNIEQMAYGETYTLRVSANINGEWIDCPQRFRLIFEICSR
jgi:hypothetical protein